MTAYLKRPRAYYKPMKVRVPDPEAEFVEAVAKVCGTSMNAVIVECVRLAMEDRDKLTDRFPEDDDHE